MFVSIQTKLVDYLKDFVKMKTLWGLSFRTN